MYLILMSMLVVYAQEIQIRNYSIFETIETDKQWLLKGEDGFYHCTADTSCKGFGQSETIISGRALWYDPIMVIHTKSEQKSRCYLKTCVRPKPLTYADLKGFNIYQTYWDQK